MYYVIASDCPRHSMDIDVASGEIWDNACKKVLHLNEISLRFVCSFVGLVWNRNTKAGRMECRWVN